MTSAFLLAGLILAFASFMLIGGTAGIVIALCIVVSALLLAWVSRA
ncbi:MAG TPA: hypothetical protein VNN21_09280 [Dehalococcoidia bacterium]|nr:hypothetical protein [Dehalococcoidia bacterium]